MAQPLDFSALLSDPAFAEEFKKGYARGEAIAQTVANTPTQPQVQGIEMAASPKDMQKQMYALLQKSMGQQQQQVEQLKAEAEKEKQRQEQMGVLGKIDLRPFAQALQQYGSTTVAVPKEAPEDRTEILRKLQAAVSQAEQGLTKEQVAFLKTMAQDRETAQAVMSQKNLEKRMFDTAQEKVLRPAQDFQKTAGAYNTVRSEISTGQPTRINRALSQYARIMGQTGVLTDQDIRMQMGPTAVGAIENAINFLSANPEGTKLPDAVVKDLLASLDAGHNALKQATRRKIDTIEESYALSPYAGSPWMPNLFSTAKKALGPQEAGASPSGIPSMEAIKAERERRKKK
jgi:hypothetical protein